MASSITFSELTQSKSLEIKMTNILSFYESIATAIALQANDCNFDFVIIEPETQKSPPTPTSKELNYNKIQNSINFSDPPHRSTDIVDYLIEREQRQSS